MVVLIRYLNLHKSTFRIDGLHDTKIRVRPFSRLTVILVGQYQGFQFGPLVEFTLTQKSNILSLVLLYQTTDAHPSYNLQMKTPYCYSY